MEKFKKILKKKMDSYYKAYPEEKKFFKREAKTEKADKKKSNS